MGSGSDPVSRFSIVATATRDNPIWARGQIRLAGFLSSRPRLVTTLYGRGVRSGWEVFYSRDRDSGQPYMGSGSDSVSRFSIVATATRDNPL